MRKTINLWGPIWLAGGIIPVPGIVPDGQKPLEKARVENGCIELPPPCRYCAFDRLCARKPELEKKR